MTHMVVMGVAGCGKSMLSRQIAQRLGCEGVEGDDFHLPASQEKMRAGIPLDDTDREPWLAAIGRMMAAAPGDHDVELIGGGLRTADIAERLHLSVKTIESYREHIKQKLELGNAAQLTRAAVEWIQTRRLG